MSNSDVMPLLDVGQAPASQPGLETGIKPFAPTSVTTFVASLMEPAIAVTLLLLLAWHSAGVLERPVLLLAVLTLLVSFPAENRFHHKRSRAIFDIWVSWAAKAGFLAVCGWVSLSFRFFDPVLLTVWALATPALHTVGLLAGRMAIQKWFSQDDKQRPALVVGAGEVGVRVARVLEQRAKYGVQFVGFLEDRMVERQHAEARDKVLGRFADLSALVRRHGVRDVYVTLPLSMQPRIRKLLAETRDEAVSIFLVPDVFGMRIIQGTVRVFDGVPVVSLLVTPFEGVNGLLKRVSDIAIASVALLLLAPVMAAIAVGVKKSSPGPVLFKQRRHGMDGKEIMVYKFRSMTTQDNGAVVKQAQRGDARITPFGAFLRRTSLDELPQFINVLQGRMSVVGPRPHAVAHNEMYEKLIPAYMVRHKVKPGITGWAQVNGLRGETDTDDKMAARVSFDLDYLRMWTLGMDLRIIARTVRVVFGDKHAY